jgi:hypothetical protein
MQWLTTASLADSMPEVDRPGRFVSRGAEDLRQAMPRLYFRSANCFLALR